MNKWAFFLDIDGTVAVNGEMPQDNILAINKAVKNGHYVFLCTGRPYSMTKHLLDVANWSGIICSMGAEVILNGEFVRKETIPDDFARIVAEEVLKTDIWVAMGNGETCISLNEHHNTPYVRVNDMNEFMKQLDGITKVDILDEVPEEIKSILSERMDVITHATYSECAIKGFSKSESIAFVLDKLKLDRKFSVAVGDSLNDIDMIKYAGIGVAMGNAISEVKEIADRITDDCASCGVAKIICEITNKFVG